MTSSGLIARDNSPRRIELWDKEKRVPVSSGGGLCNRRCIRRQRYIFQAVPMPVSFGARFRNVL